MYQHEVSLRDDGIIQVTMVGDSDVPEAEQCQREIAAILEREPGTTRNGLVDLTRAGVASVPAQHVFAELMAHPQIGRIALVNAPPIPKMLGEVVAKFARKESVQFFSSEEEAKQWLAQGMS